MDERAKQAAAMALNVMKRKDSAVESIVAMSSHAVAYELSYKDEPRKWRRLGMEGPLFLVQRAEEPRFKVVIRNQKGITDLNDMVAAGSLEVDLQDAFLMYRMHGEAVHGIWFYETSDCATFAHLLERANRGELITQAGDIPVKPEAEGGLERFFPGLPPGAVLSPPQPSPMPVTPAQNGGDYLMNLLGVTKPVESSPNSAVATSVAALKIEGSAPAGKLTREEFVAVLDRAKSDPNFLESMYRSYMAL